MGRWLIIATLLALLALTVWIVVEQWSLVNVDVPAWAWAAIAVGALLAILVGGGLMGLIFYSNRAGYDEPPHRIDRPDEE
jgi:hypothetical protein